MAMAIRMALVALVEYHVMILAVDAGQQRIVAAGEAGRYALFHTVAPGLFDVTAGVLAGEALGLVHAGEFIQLLPDSSRTV